MKDHEYIFGYHVIESVLHAEPELVKQVYYLGGRKDARAKSITAMARELNIPVAAISRAELTQKAGALSVHQGIAAEVRLGSGFDESLLYEMLRVEERPKTFLVLDGVQDPHNLGACLRSANAFGVDAVIAPKDRAAGLTPAARKVASGAAEMTPFIQVTNLARTLTRLQEQEVWVVGLCGEVETDIADIDLSGNIAIVMGSEGSGIRKLTRKNCDYLAQIPMLGEIESLNVSAATAVVLYEIVRQRASSSLGL